MIVALATHGISYTPDQVRAMTGDDLDALSDVLEERAVEESREAAMAESRAKSQAGARGRR